MANLDASFFKPFVDGTKHILKVSCQIDAVAGKVLIKQKGDKPQLNIAIAGVIALTSSGFVGSITLCFPESVFLSLMSTFLGEKFSQITPDLQDGAGELLNMIFGHAKVILNEQGHTIQKAIPTVIRGQQLETTHLGAGKVVVLPFNTPAGEFHIEICAE